MVLLFVMLIIACILIGHPCGVSTEMCSSIETETFLRVHKVPRPVDVTYIGKCRKMWFNINCIKYRTEYEYQNEYTTEQRTKLVRTCCPGHTKSYDIESDTHTCVPLCDRNCTNGICSNPNVCNCNDGYKMSNVSGICVPLCNDECINANCTQPNVCSCHAEHRFVTDSLSVCEPILNKLNCTNGRWVPPNNCECDEGYNINNGTNWMETPCLSDCANGYKFDETRRQCQPYCDKACGKNGKCISPGQCKCLDGFREVPAAVQQSNTSGSCQPYCENCTNGKCTAPQQCTCNSGYKRNVLLNECQPDCQPNCTNGKCVSPNRCVCNSGFMFAAINSTYAAATCVKKATDAPESSTTKERPLTTTFSSPTESEQSTTTATDVSSKIEDLTFCFQQNCSTDGCNKCPDGYKVTASSSSASPIMFCCPMCSVACVHGNCVEPEMCLCWQGYRVSNSYNATDSNVCHPICASSSDNITDACINGHCVAYNQCECFAGFELSGAVDNVTCVAKSESTSNASLNGTLKEWTLEIVTIIVILAVLAAVATVAYLRYRRNQTTYPVDPIYYQSGDD